MKTDRRLVTDAEAARIREALEGGDIWENPHEIRDLLDTREELIAALEDHHHFLGEQKTCRKCAILAQVRGES